jgi:hypothetical protein
MYQSFPKVSFHVLNASLFNIQIALKMMYMTEVTKTLSPIK